MSQPQEDNHEDRQVFLAAYDPLMARYQAAELKQLTKEHERLEIELMQVEEKSKALRRQKEDIGVRLYGVQQQLAENQVEYERAHENFNQIQKTRLDEEQKLKHVNEMFEGKKGEVEDLRRKKEKAQKELDTTILNVHKVGKFNENSKNQILITKTVTHTAEENVVQLEKSKKKQDYLIDQMTEEIKCLIEETNIISAQLVSQKAETEEAKAILREAQKEMQKILSSRKNLMERWQKSLSVMSQMDVTLQSIRDQLNHEKELNLQLKAESAGIAIEIHKENAVTKEILEKAGMLADQKRKLDEQTERIANDRKRIVEQRNILTESLDNTEKEIGRAEKERQSIEDSMNNIESNIMKLHTKTKQEVEELINEKSLHTTIEKTTANLQKQVLQVINEIEVLQIELANLQNEIARVNIDKLNTQSQIEALEKKKAEVIEERKKRELLVATYEINIRQSQELNEKKQHEVGQLNKTHDKLTSMENDENSGLHETKLRSLVNETDELAALNEELLQEWMKKQTKLVHESNELERLNESILSLQTKKTILEQKKVRLNEDYRGYEREIAEIRISLKNLQKDMNKLNDGLAVNGDRHRVLENEIFSIDSEFAEKLKELQKDTVRLEIDINSLKEEKAMKLEEIVEAERQILLWERKIVMEKEVKSELDPDIGQSELKQLKKDIHIQELKYDSMRKEQEKLQNEMVIETQKRETIELMYTRPEPERVRGGRSVPHTSAQMQSNIKMLKHQIDKTTGSTKEVEKMLKAKQGEHEEIAARIEESGERCNSLEAEVNGLANRLASSRLLKLVNIHEIKEKQEVSKKIEELRDKRPKLMMSEAQLRDKFADLRSKNRQVLGLVEEVMERMPHLEDVLKPVLLLNRQL